MTPVKLNGIQVKQFPSTCYSFEADITEWKLLREIIQGKNVVAALSRGKVCCFGERAEIEKTFDGHIKSKISIEDFDEKLLERDNSFYVLMLYDLIKRTLAGRSGLKEGSRKNSYFLEDRKISGVKSIGGSEAYEGFNLSLTFLDKKLWLLLNPSVEIRFPSKDKISFKEKKDRKLIKQTLSNEILSNRYNKKYDEELNKWLNYLRNKSDSVQFSIENFSMDLDARFCYAGYKLTDKAYFFQGMDEQPDSALRFHPTEENYMSIHPLKGLKKFGPYDCSFEEKRPNIKVALITPDKGFDTISRHLNGLNDAKSPITEKDYLIEYPGFNSIYQRFLEVPNSRDSKCCVLIRDEDTAGKSQLKFYELLKRKIDYFDTLRGEFDILVIYFPGNYSEYRELKDETAYFDLHDSVKIYCAKKNIKVQFVEEKSTIYKDQAKVRWWLSLATYVKANGIPWRVKEEEKNSAYIGIGYAVKTKSKEIVIGCSQLFDSSGQGLRFLLQPIENPVYYGKNSYMSREDARRLVLRLKEAYLQMNPNTRLDKLVIHKTTHFTRDEMEGIAQAVEGIDRVELLQIQRNTCWRGMRLFKGYSGKHGPDGYPVKRGTVVQLDADSLLIWTHGAIMNNEIAGQRRNYYQGGRGIPSPLLVKRFWGKDSAETISSDMLKLTKMNWNGGQLYKKMPVTLDFSRILSEIAKQEESLHSVPYDFRFFM